VGTGRASPGAVSPLIGRLPELELIRNCLIAASRGEGSTIIISGESGIGKTRLIREASTLARKHQFTISSSSLIEDHWQPPWQSWIEIVGQALGAMPPGSALASREGPAWAPPLAELCPTVRDRFPHAPRFAPASEQERRFLIRKAFVSCLQDLGFIRPHMMVIDDLQWMEPESLHLLPYLVAGIPGHRLLLVLLVREHPSQIQTDLESLLGQLRRDDHVQSIRLTGFDSFLIGQFVASLARRPISDSMIRLIADASHGNPLFIQELTRSLIEENLIDATTSPVDHQQWLATLRLPDSLRQVIEFRLSRLRPESSEMLHLAAICEDTGFDDAMLAALTGFEESGLLDAIDEVLAANLVMPHPEWPDRYRFQEPLIRQVLYASWGPSRRIRLHRKLAETLAAQSPHHHAAEIARHYHASASLPGREAGIPFAIAAANRATRPTDVVQLYRIARDLAEAEPPDRRASILTSLAVAEAEAFELDAALFTIEDALDAQREAGAPAGAQAAMIATTVTALHDAGMPDDAWMPTLRYGLELTPPEDRMTWARLTLLIDRFEVIVDGIIHGSRWLGSDAEAVEIARSCGDEELYARSLQPWDLWERSWTEELSRRIRTWSKPAAIIRGLTVSGADWLYHHGDVRRAQSDFEDLLDIATRTGHIPGQAEAHVRLALIHMACGRFDIAAGMESEARNLVAQLGRGHRLHASLWWLTALRTEYQQGDWEPIATWLLDHVANPDIARGTVALDDAALAALALVRSGRPDKARQLLAMLVEVLNRIAPDLWLLNGLAGFGAAAIWELQDAALAPDFRDLALGLLAQGFGDFPGSCLHLTVARMTALLQDGEGANRAFDQARAHLDLSGQEPQRAMVEFDQALTLATSAPQRAQAMLDEAIARFRKLHMDHWVHRALELRDQWKDQPPALPFDPGTLSHREIEVLQLIARGQSDRQIGERLFVSPRTVNAHIRNMLAKTRTNNRTELTVWALEHGIVSPPH